MSLAAINNENENNKNKANNGIIPDDFSKGWKVFAFTCGWSLITLMTFGLQ